MVFVDHLIVQLAPFASLLLHLFNAGGYVGKFGHHLCSALGSCTTEDPLQSLAHGLRLGRQFGQLCRHLLDNIERVYLARVQLLNYLVGIEADRLQRSARVATHAPNSLVGLADKVEALLAEYAAAGLRHDCDHLIG